MIQDHPFHLNSRQTEELVKNIANQMRDPLFVRERVFDPKNRNPSQSTVPWKSIAISHGYAALLLLFAALDDFYPNEGWGDVSHAYVLKLKEEISAETSMDFSLFGGLTGSCFAIQMASKNKTRYVKLLSKLNDYLIQSVEKVYFEPIKEKFDLQLPLRAELYDVVSGIIGVGVYALNNLDDPLFLNLLQQILELCITLILRKIPLGSYQVPGWYLPSHYQFLEIEKQQYPKGNFNLGIAHGVSGIIAFLSIASLRGICLPAQKEAIEWGASWLEKKKKMGHEHFYWLDRCSFEEETQESAKQASYFTMDAWCYGTAGVARTLYLAGKALHNASYQQLGLKAFQGIFSRSQGSSPTFCHGQAGLLTLTHLMARDTNNEELYKQLPILEEKLLSCYRPEFPFGFRDEEPLSDQEFILNQQTAQQHPTIGVDKAGILDGISGILLSLLSYKKQDSRWIELFLIEDRP